MLRPMLGTAGRGRVVLIAAGAGSPTAAQSTGPVMLDPRLGVRPVAQGLNLPTTMAFLGADDMLVLEKNTGRCSGWSTARCRAPCWTWPSTSAPSAGCSGSPCTPTSRPTRASTCTGPRARPARTPTCSSETPLLGNRVDRFVWNGSALTFDRNLIRLRAIQQDAGQPERGNHDGGVLAFGTDGKLYVFIGDVGRRGQLQNLPCGPTATCPGPTVPDDQFGGPEPDDAHLTGVVLRLNDDGTTPTDNPFFAAGAAMGGEVGANIQKIFSYGHRNSFGMAVDPRSGGIWLQENGDDSFSELNRVEPGMNGGWIQIVGPVERIAQFKEIETTFGTPPALQQLRWPPDQHRRHAGARRLSRLFMLPGAHYSDPEFSWKWEVAPGGIGFVDGPRPRPAVRRRSVRRARRRRTWPAATCSTST